MKKSIKYFVYSSLVLTCIVLSLYVYFKYFNFSGSIATYHIYADKLDMNTVNSYPQSIVKVLKKEPYYELNISVKPVKSKIASIKLKENNYSKEVSKYLEPTNFIQCDDDKIKSFAKEIIGEEEDVIKIAESVAKWTSKNIEFDMDLVKKISDGDVISQDAIETINRKKGTSGEYANVFIAVMRSLGIPTKYITGHRFGGTYDAWAEIYIKGVGWIPVDPQLGIIGSDNRYIKLFEGKDFADLNIEFKDIRFGVEKLK